VPLYFQQEVSPNTRMAVWKIEEEESFFLKNMNIPIPASHPVKRLQHLAGRYLLPFLYPDFQVAQITIADSRKPFLLNDAYHFSISHSENYAAAIVSSKMHVGIDVETITERVQKVQHKFLSEDELNSLINLSKQELINQLTVLWSAKEAMYKWWGKGEVDFKEHLQTQYFQLQQGGIINAVFSKHTLQYPRELNYKLADGLSIVWLESEFN